MLWCGCVHVILNDRGKHFRAQHEEEEKKEGREERIEGGKRVWRHEEEELQNVDDFFSGKKSSMDGLNTTIVCYK